MATPADFADLAAYGSELAATIPGYALREACTDREGHRLAPSRRRDCITVLDRLADQPALSHQLKALRLMLPLLGQSEVHRLRREQYRQLQWLLQKMPFVQYPLGSGAAVVNPGVKRIGRSWSCARPAGRTIGAATVSGCVLMGDLLR